MQVLGLSQEPTLSQDNSYKYDVRKLSVKDLQKWRTGLFAANPVQAMRLVQRISELEFLLSQNKDSALDIKKEDV